MAKILIDDSWNREVYKNGLTAYTFCGALEYRYSHIAKNWNADTRKKHEREYNNIILPALRNHNEKGIGEYTKDDFEEAIESIKEKGYEKDGVRRQYSESSIHNFENLIYYVVFQSSIYGLCENVLWGTKFVLDSLDEEAEIEEHVVLKKSLTVSQEKRFAQEVMSNPYDDGAIVALVLMWGIGVRNGEACGLNYGDIKPLDGYPGCYVAWIYKSTKVKSAEVQSGGKTYNTGRVVPIPDRIMDYISSRRDMIEKVLKSRGESDIDINILPICSDGCIDFDNNNYVRRCKADYVTSAAHRVFENVGISSRQLAYLDEELSEGNVAKILKEKEPTAYLLRRNFATHMCILGLTNAEMQYLIGHDVEDAYESRNEFVDNDRIYSMYLKLKQRELLNEKDVEYNKAEIRIHDEGTMKIHISAKEPTDGIHVSVESGMASDVETIWYEETRSAVADRTINILETYHQQYS